MGASGCGMIEMLGLFAALFAGFMADGLMSGSDAPEQTDSADSSDFILGDKAGMPQSSDGDLPNDPDQNLSGTDGTDLLAGGAGTDTIWAGEGGDEIVGHGGDDSIFAGAGQDTVMGGAGRDMIAGQDQNDMIYAGPGADTVAGGAGDDQLFGGAGADVIAGDAGKDSIDGGDGHDLITGGDGADELFGGAGDDTIWGQDDFVNGGAGDDQLTLGAAATGNGGDGADSFAITDYGSAAAQIVDFDPAQDHLVIQYDAQQIPNPLLSIQAGDAGETLVLLNGKLVASLTNGADLQADQVSLRAI